MTMRSQHHAVYVISVAAELAGMHPQTLRIYERRGLVQPARTQGGNRRYSDVDIECLRRISELAAEGMNLEGIRRVMQLETENEQLRAENAELREVASSAMAEADRRSPRRDLVPLRQEVSVFGGSRLGRSELALVQSGGSSSGLKRRSACQADRITSATSVRSSCIDGNANGSVATTHCGIASSSPANSCHSVVSNGEGGGAGGTRRRWRSAFAREPTLVRGRVVGIAAAPVDQQLGSAPELGGERQQRRDAVLARIVPIGAACTRTAARRHAGSVGRRVLVRVSGRGRRDGRRSRR